MVEKALLHSLHLVRGGAAAAEEFLDWLHTMRQEGIPIEDDTVYDDPRLRPPRAKGNDIPESVAAAGLEETGQVHIGLSL